LHYLKPKPIEKLPLLLKQCKQKYNFVYSNIDKII
jgi:hypothetical protein